MILRRIYSQIFKNLMSMKRNPFRLADIFIWPLIFLFTLTFFVTYLGSDAVYLNTIILGMIGWRIVYFLNLEIVSSFVDEYWSKSLPYLIISPITRLEFAIGSAISGIIKAFFVTLLYLVATNLLYGFYISNWIDFVLGCFFLVLVGLSMGLINLGFAFFMKEQSFSLAFIFPDVLVLLSGVYFSVESVYPKEILPLINALPSTQAFNLLKSVAGTSSSDYGLLIVSVSLSLILAYFFNGYMYEKSKKHGRLTRLG